MSSSNNEIGFQNQKLLLAILLIAIWKDINWSYEGKNENEADFQIGEKIYECKTFVDGKNHYIKDSAPPNEIKKAIFQLFSNKSNKSKNIITNRRILLKDSNIGLQDSEYSFFDIFKKGAIKHKESIFKENEVAKIKIIVKGVSNGKNIKEIEEKAINEFRQYLSKNKKNLNVDDISNGKFKIALASFSSSVLRNISKENSKNPLRHNLFYVISNLNSIDINFEEKDDLERLENGIRLASHLDFIRENDEKIKEGLLQLKFSNKEIKEILDNQKNIRKWKDILE